MEENTEKSDKDNQENTVYLVCCRETTKGRWIQQQKPRTKSDPLILSIYLFGKNVIGLNEILIYLIFYPLKENV